MGDRHLSRRELLEAIPVVSRGALLVPLFSPAGQAAGNGAIRGRLREKATGKAVAAKLRVTDAATGEPYMPAASVKSMPKKSPSGVRYFYIRENYEIAVPAGRYRLEAVRGIAEEPEIVTVEVPAQATIEQDFDFRPVRDLRAAGWYSGNTHTHYNVNIEESVDQRMRIVPPAEGVDVSVISYLIRNKLPYSSNRIPIGRMPEFSRDGVLMDMGEECRNNFISPERPHNLGYGHCLFVNIPRLVEPVSTGQLSPSGSDPDFPTLSMLCAEAKRIGGTTIWCHNGHGMEAPIAVALGHIDALNISDGFPVEYGWYYQLLDCGFRLPISTGTDWWEYDHNRVFVKVEGSFTYDAWLAGLRAGRTFVSNGPLLELTANGTGPGAILRRPDRVKVVAQAISRVPFDRLELVHDGSVVAEKSARDGREARIEWDGTIQRDGWLAARIGGKTKTRTGYEVFAHTNPIYVQAGTPSTARAVAAAAIGKAIEQSVIFLRKNFRFATQADQALAVGRFEEGRRFYAALAAGSSVPPRSAA